MVTQQQVGARLAELRNKAGLRQDQAAEKAGISKDTLSRIERGVQWTDFTVLSTLARLYKVEWADLLAVFPEGSDANQRAVVQEIVDILRPRKLAEVELARDILRVLFRVER